MNHSATGVVRTFFRPRGIAPGRSTLIPTLKPCQNIWHGFIAFVNKGIGKGGGLRLARC